MNVLVINAGSSSLKYQLLNPTTGELLAKGLCERIGIDGLFTYKPQLPGKEAIKAASVSMPTHNEAIQAGLNALVDEKNGGIGSMKEIDAVGHRVVHGGEKFAKSVVITDEVMAGFGRTGFWFALDDYDYTPDIISFAKGCNSGYVPAGGVIMSDPVAHRFDDIVFPGGLTYSGHPLAMGAIVATQEAMEEEHIVDNAYTIGKDVLGPQLTALYDKHPKIGEVRGKGVFWAVEMVADRTTKEPLDDATMKQIVADGDKRGLILGVHNNRIHVTPPCVISADEATQGVEILDQVLTAAGC